MSSAMGWWGDECLVQWDGGDGCIVLWDGGMGV